MKHFGRKKEKEQAPGAEAVEGEDALTEDVPAEGEVRASEVEAPTTDPEAPASPQDVGPVVEPDGGDKGFFDLPPDEVKDYMPAGAVVAAHIPIEFFKPLMKVLALILIFAGIVAGIVFIWPSSTARVPDLTGKTLTEAMRFAQSKGFQPVVTAWAYSTARPDGAVLDQEPKVTTIVKKGSTITLTVSKGPSPDQKSQPEVSLQQQAPGTAPTSPYEGKTICIDPGGQAQPGVAEWTDPGMTRKTHPTEVLLGSTTGNAECAINLDIALKLKGLLEKDGIKVVMTREGNDVDTSDVMRAQIANNAGADLSVRIHCASSTDPLKMGTQTLYPADSTWTQPIEEKSQEAALFIEAEMIKTCETNDLGAVTGHDVPGFNWSSVPVVQPEPGYLTNPRDDTMLAEDQFRWKVAWGIRNGIMKYLANP